MALNTQNPRVVAAAVVALLAVVGSVIARLGKGCQFVEVAPNVYRCTQPFFPVQLNPVLIKVDESKGLLFKSHKNRWILVDASHPDSALFGSWSSKLMRAVQRKLHPPGTRKPADKLDLIVLTHAHTDHVGALPQLLRLYPEAKVVTHVEELRFIVGDAPSSHFEGPGLAKKLIKAAAGKTEGVPADRAIHVHGEGGDLAEALHGSAATKNSMKWLPHGTLRFIHNPGHTPGHMALLHVPSSTLLAGDAVRPRLSGLLLGKLGSPGLDTPLSAANTWHSLMKPRAKQLLEQENYKLVLPYHGGAFTREQALKSVSDWSTEPLEPPSPTAVVPPGPEAVAGKVPEEGKEGADAGEGGGMKIGGAEGDGRVGQPGGGAHDARAAE